MPPLRRLLAALVALAVLSWLAPGGTHHAHAAISVTTGLTRVSTTGPLMEFDVGVDATMQIVDSRVSYSGEFYNPYVGCSADLGVFVTIGNVVYGPDPHAPWHCPNSRFNNPNVVYVTLSQTSSGTGTAASPYTVVTTVRLTSTITLTQTVTYVSGQESLRETNTLKSSAGPVSAKIFNAGEPDAGTHDRGYGYYDAESGAVGAINPISTADYHVYPCTSAVVSNYFYSALFRPITPWQHSVVDDYATVYNDVSAGAHGASLPDTHNQSCIDPAIAVEWDVTVAAGSSTSVAKDIVFTSNAPTLKPGAVTGHIVCNSTTAPMVTCDPVPPPNLCHMCSRTFNVFLPVTCSGAGTIDIQNRTCSGTITGMIGLAGYTMTVKSGGITPEDNRGGLAILHGTGIYYSAGAAYTVTADDNDVTGVDTVRLVIQGRTGIVNMNWTCRSNPRCLEVTPS